MAKSTTKLFEVTLLTQRAKVSGFGASLLLHIVLGLTLVALPVTYVERWEDVKRQVVVPLIVPRVAVLENPDLPRLQPKPRYSPKLPVPRERGRAPRFETPAPEKARAPSPVTAPIEPAPLLARTAPVPVLPRVEPSPVPALQPAVRTGLLPSAVAAPARQEPPKLAVQAGKFAEVEIEGVQRRNGVATKTGGFEAAAEVRAAPTGAGRRTVVAANFGGPRLGSDSRERTRGKVTAASSFGRATAHGVLGKAGGTVRPAAFEEIVVERQPRERPRAKTEENLSSRVQIIEKFRPAYTAAAREQQIEGEVLIEVLFQASGTIQVLGIVKRLGYGLDERAVEAARKIRFKPASLEGKPIDSRARVRITFQLAY